MKIPVITGEGRHIDLDSDDYVRLVLLPEACGEVDPRLWEMFAQDEPVIDLERSCSPVRP